MIRPARERNRYDDLAAGALALDRESQGRWGDVEADEAEVIDGEDVEAGGHLTGDVRPRDREARRVRAPL